MKNILFLISSLNRGGTENQLIELVNRLNPVEFRLHIVTFQGMTEREIVLRNGVWVEWPFAGFKSLGTCRFIKLLMDYCRNERIDIIQSFFFTENVLAAVVSILTGIPHVISARNLFPNKSLVHCWMQGLLLRRAASILANSEIVKHRVIELSHVAGEKITVIHNGIDTARFVGIDLGDGQNKVREHLGIDPDAFVVVMVANFRPEKNHPCLLEAINLVKQKSRDIKVVLLGDGPLRNDIEELSRRLNLEGEIRFEGTVSDVMPYLRAADVGLLVSTHEGLPNALLEYMAAGLPVVASDVGGCGEIVRVGETGFLFANSDYGALADRLFYLMENKTTTSTMGKTAMEKVRNSFSITVMKKKYEKFYRGVG